METTKEFKVPSVIYGNENADFSELYDARNKYSLLVEINDNKILVASINGKFHLENCLPENYRLAEEKEIDIIINSKELSGNNKDIIYIYEKGYSIVNGIVYNPDGNAIKTNSNKYGYKRFSFRNEHNKIRSTTIHKLIALSLIHI